MLISGSGYSCAITGAHGVLSAIAGFLITSPYVIRLRSGAPCGLGDHRGRTLGLLCSLPASAQQTPMLPRGEQRGAAGWQGSGCDPYDHASGDGVAARA